MKKTLIALLYGASCLATAGQAMAQDAGIPVTLFIVDLETQEPIGTAKVRHPEEKDAHPVNADNGSMNFEALYLPNGDEILFTKGYVLVLEVSAPGYENRKVEHTIKKRKNVLSVPLRKMELKLEDENIDDIVIQFGRDKPIE